MIMMMKAKVSIHPPPRSRETTTTTTSMGERARLLNMFSMRISANVDCCVVWLFRRRTEEEVAWLGRHTILSLFRRTHYCWGSGSTRLLSSALCV